MPINQWMNWPKLWLCESCVGMRRMGPIYSIYSYGHHPVSPTSHWLRHSKRKTSAASGTWDAQKGQPSNCSGSSWIGLAMATAVSRCLWMKELEGQVALIPGCSKVTTRSFAQVHVIIHTSLSCTWWPWHKLVPKNLVWGNQDPYLKRHNKWLWLDYDSETKTHHSVRICAADYPRPHRNLLALAFRLPWLLFIPST